MRTLRPSDIVARLGMVLATVLVPCILALLFIACSSSPNETEARGVKIRQSSLYVKFSPKGGCTEAIVSEVGKATNSVLVLAYSFTSKPIFNALLNAKRRGVDVRVVVDGNQRGKTSLVWQSVSNGIPILLDHKHAISHNKVIVIDGWIVITGSFNFSAAAENNAENLLVIRSPGLAAQYVANWGEHAGHSVNP